MAAIARDTVTAILVRTTTPTMIATMVSAATDRQLRISTHLFPTKQTRPHRQERVGFAQTRSAEHGGSVRMRRREFITLTISVGVLPFSTYGPHQAMSAFST